MLTMQGEQQQATTPAGTDSDVLRPSDSDLGSQGHESSKLPAKRKRPARATTAGKAKRNKITGLTTTSQNPHQPPKRTQQRGIKDSEEHDAVTDNSAPGTGGGLGLMDSTPISKGLASHPIQKEAPSRTPGVPGQGLQDGLGKMMEAMHSFMASAKVLVGLGIEGQGASSKQAGTRRVWGQGRSQPMEGQGRLPLWEQKGQM
ncbi:hypothetical protein NDU88_003339 [Pleurodeles waltl]|uniref:Uncharacterized protein n=1 Tax=Pleurodeles waltl TaxID=8319 RepID=A0AAV7TPG3_PLEWA|nr:hypothetical protein NDU88_003339 [Pleurodeles waltl]